MDQRVAVQSIISAINTTKRDIENFPKSGMSRKSMDELDLAYNSLNDVLNHCNTAMQHL